MYKSLLISMFCIVSKLDVMAEFWVREVENLVINKITVILVLNKLYIIIFSRVKWNKLK
jgi:hypothetical protein